MLRACQTESVPSNTPNPSRICMDTMLTCTMDYTWGDAAEGRLLRHAG